MSRFVARVGIGAVVSYPIVCLLAGGLKEGFLVLVLSIVCTVGISLVAWVPVWWVVGSGTLLIIEWIYNTANKVEKKETDGKRTPAPNRGDQALKAYIKHAMATGMDEDVMICRLHLNGWNMVEIQAARQNLTSSQSKA